jgi:hypothetical protein
MGERLTTSRLYQFTESRLARIHLAPHISRALQQLPGAANREGLEDCVMGERLNASRLC